MTCAVSCPPDSNAVSSVVLSANVTTKLPHVSPNTETCALAPLPAIKHRVDVVVELGFDALAKYEATDSKMRVVTLPAIAARSVVAFGKRGE